jgi:hypothetical protein
MSFIHTRFHQNSLLTPGEKVSGEQLVEEAKILAFERNLARINRRAALEKIGLAGAAAGTLALTGGLAGCSNGGTIVTTGTTIQPVDVLNFALNLEYLEASFYLYVTTGSGLSTTDQGANPGTVSGGAKIAFTNPEVNTIAQNLASDEQAHVEFLRSTITAVGGTPVSLPALNLAAMGAPTNDATFIALARQLETVGVSAYEGGIAYLVSNTQAVTYAASIHDTEAQHEGFLRQLCINLGVASPAVDSMDLPPTSTQIFNTSPTTGLNTVRTPSQVLQIVYGAAGQIGVSKGGFYPNGMNGNITTT